MRSIHASLISLLLTAGCSHALAQVPPGVLDPSFGSGGYAVFDPFPSSTDGLANGIAVQSNGKIVFSGSATNTVIGPNRMVVARLTEDGLSDPSFGGSLGFVIPPTPAVEVFEPVVALHFDDKILCGGWGQKPGSSSLADFQLSRLDSSGSADLSFNPSGTDILLNSYDIAEGLAVFPDSSIVQVGFSYTQYPALVVSIVSVVKYLENGLPDTSFSSDGKNNYQFSAIGTNVPRWVGTSVAAQPDGKIVVAGYGLNEAGTYYVGLVFRLLPDGSLDPAFSAPDGYRILYAFPGGYANPSFWAVALEEDGRIVLAGSALRTGTGYYDAMVMRLLPNGTPDPGFGPPLHPGISVFNSSGSAFDDDIRGLAIDQSGHYIVAGRGGGNWMLGCLDRSGALAPGFGPAGAGYGHYDHNLIHAVAVDRSNRIVAAGDAGMNTIIVGHFDNFTGTRAYEKIRLALRVYPNPGNGAVWVEHATTRGGAVLYRVTDSSGKVVMEYSCQYPDAGEQHLKLEPATQLPPGYYWLSVETESEFGAAGFIRR